MIPFKKPASLLLVFFAFSWLNCAQQATGILFLDEDGDNERDSGELKLANVPFTATLDGDELDLDDSKTDANGNFEFSLEGAGEYCVTIDDADLLINENDDGTIPEIVEPSDLVKVEALFATGSETDCGDGEDDDGDGLTDCSDTDCSDSTDCSEETDCGDGLDDDDDGDVDCDDSDCDTDSECDNAGSTDDEEEDTTTITSGQGCTDSTGFGFDMDIPVAMDYASVEDRSDSDTETVAVGETVTITILYPISCDFELLDVPSDMTPTGVGDAFDDASDELDLTEVEAAADVEAGEVNSINVDQLASFDVSFVIEDGFESATIQGEVVCPDDSTVSLQSHRFEIEEEVVE